MNRVLNSFAAAELVLKKRLKSGEVTQKQLDDCSNGLDINSEELTVFKNVNSLAAANGTLGHEESMTVYALLTGGVEAFNKESVGVKLTVTNLIKQLMNLNRKAAMV